MARMVNGEVYVSKIFVFTFFFKTNVLSFTRYLQGRKKFELVICPCLFFRLNCVFLSARSNSLSRHVPFVRNTVKELIHQINNNTHSWRDHTFFQLILSK